MKYRFFDAHITMECGSGGAASRELVEKVIFPYFRSETYSILSDASSFAFPREHGGVRSYTGRLLMTTDTYTVDPPFFPGGDIGMLSIFGTCNDLSVSGAKPQYLSVGFILEEGFEIENLTRALASMARAAEEAQVSVITGDTKVVPRGKGGGIYINTCGIGLGEASPLPEATRVRPGDTVIFSGPLGSHGIAVLAARENLALAGGIRSDVGCLYPLCATLFPLGENLRFMRDATRGGAAAVLNEIASGAGVGIEINETRVVVEEEVSVVSDLLGLNPLEIANEGVFIAIVAQAEEERAIESLRAVKGGEKAAAVGLVTEAHPGIVILETEVRGRRILGFPRGLLLPRIC